MNWFRLEAAGWRVSFGLREALLTCLLTIPHGPEGHPGIQRHLTHDYWHPPTTIIIERHR